MKCPQCSSEMEKGGLMHDGNKWFDEGHFVDVQRKSFGGEVIFAFRCAQCGKVELTTKVESSS